MPPHVPDCLIGGSLIAVVTASVGAILHRAIRIAVAEGKADAATLRRIAVMRAWFGVFLLSGVVLTVQLIAGLLILLGRTPLSRQTTRMLIDGFFWTYLVWAPAAGFAILATGRWGRRALRSFPVLWATEARARLVWFRLRRSPPAEAIRTFRRKYDRPLW